MTRLLLIIFVSFLTIELAAETLQVPYGCVYLDREEKCTVLSKSPLAQVGFSHVDVRMSEKSVVQKDVDKKIHLIHGKMLIEVVGQETLHTLYGDLNLADARVMVIVDAQRVQFTNLVGQVLYRPRGDMKTGTLPVGFTNYMARVSTDGIAPSGYSSPAVVENLLFQWARFFKKSEKSSFDFQVKQFQPHWLKAIDIAGPWYVETVDRQIAALEAERERQRRLRAKRIKEQRYYQEMFRRKNYLDYLDH